MMAAGRRVDLYKGFQWNKAWPQGNVVPLIPADAEGLCVSPFYDMTLHKTHSIKIKFGHKMGGGFGAVVFNSLSDTHSTTHFYANSNPRTINNWSYNFVSSTFTIAVLDDCYIYDATSGEYIFAGKNVDISTPPNRLNINWLCGIAEERSAA